MTMKRFTIRGALGAACFVAAMLGGGRASAQDASQPPQTGQGPMSIERLQQGWTIAPDVKFTHFDGATRTLAGAYGGWVIDNTLMIGGAGYALTDSNHTRSLSYGGAVVEWRERADQAVGFSVKGLLGVGSATASRTVTFLDVDPGHGAPAPPAPTTPTSVPTQVNVAFREQFFVAEPQIDLLLKVAPHVRLRVGGGYRAVSGANGLEPEIRGATGSVSLEFGPWSHR
jgi:hypothetical protein